MLVVDAVIVVVFVVDDAVCHSGHDSRQINTVAKLRLLNRLAMVNVDCKIHA